MKISKTIKMFGILSLVCLMTLTMVSTAAAAPDVCRNLPVSASPGDTITVELDIIMDGADKTIIEDAVPTGWTIVSASDGGSIVGGNTVNWIDSNAAPSVTQFTYDVMIPAIAVTGTYTFDGEFDLSTTGPSIQALTCGDMTMDVIADGPAPEPSDATVCRNLPVSAVPGETFTVELDITLDGADKTVVEDNVPVGWIVSNPSGSGSIVDANTVSWIDSNAAPGVTQFTYDVTIPASETPGTYAFNGEFDLSTAAPSIQTIDCVDLTMDVVAGPVSSDEPNVCRELPASANPGETFTVELDITLDGADKTVVEDNVPLGWIISNPSNGGVVDANTVSWIDADSAPGVTQFTYDVTIPASAVLGPYDFAGVFDLSTAGPTTQIIDCDTQMEVVEAGTDPECPVGEYDPIVIKPCWNFISVPFALENSSVEFVLADIDYNSVMYWNGSAWTIPTEFEPLKAYWIESNESVDQMIASEILAPLTPSAPPVMTVYPGWNAVGYTDSMAILPAELMLGSIDESYTVIKGPYDAVTGTYGQIGHNGETGVISGIHVGTDIFDMSPYEGYWVFVTQEDLLAGF